MANVIRVLKLVSVKMLAFIIYVGDTNIIYRSTDPITTTRITNKEMPKITECFRSLELNLVEAYKP